MGVLAERAAERVASLFWSVTGTEGAGRMIVGFPKPDTPSIVVSLAAYCEGRAKYAGTVFRFGRRTQVSIFGKTVTFRCPHPSK